MTTSASWIGATADWNTATDWSDGIVPNDSNTDVTLGGSGSYTVAVAGGESFTVRTVSLTDANAKLAFNGTAALTVSGGFANSGFLGLDANNGDGGGSLTIGGTLNNTSGGTVQVDPGGSNPGAATTLTLGGLVNPGGATFEVFGSTAHPATLVFTGGATSFTSNGGNVQLGNIAPLTLSSGFTNSGTFQLNGASALTVSGGFANSGFLGLDANNGDGGGSLTIGGTLNNTSGGTVQVDPGGSNPGAATTLTLGGLVNPGGATFEVFGSTAHPATLVFTGGATSFTSNGGNVQLGNIAPLTLSSGFTNSGTFQLNGASALTVSGGFANSGFLGLDANNGDRGGSLTIGGTLNNTSGGTVQVDPGGSNPGAATTLTLGGLVNPGGATFEVFGSTAHPATLVFTGGATSFTSNGGNVQLGNIAPLTLSSGFTNSGTFQLNGASALTVSGGFANSGFLGLDANNGDGGGSLTIGGTLNNTSGGTVQVVCALELERGKNAARYGEWPFEIGLWVGKAATPNILGQRGDGRSDSARTKVRQFKADPKGKPSPIPLENCPWCGTRFGPDSFALLPNDDQPRELRIVCTNFECDFTRDRPLPIVAVDEPLYRRLPAFLIATVDKFASLPWVGQSGALLGGAGKYDATGFYGAAEPGKGVRLATPLPPPDLVIQDELHLISGPLGTMAGLYEAAIEALCVREIDGHAVRPKIVASTATVRRAQDQIQALFARPQTQVFPPPGPDRRNSFFARMVPASETAARLYLGIAAQGRNPKVIMRKVWLALMGAAERAYRDAGGHKNEENPADPYMTVLGYFNSLRELGGARRILEEEVQNTIKAYGSRKRVGEERGFFQDRKTFSEVVELTSRVSTDKVAEARRRLETPFHIAQRVDCAIATNMISVGLDIPRLGLMVVFGQPKTTAEYIQATSRVGRDDERPGLVVTLLNIHKPRDRSHYERFRHYHETFYRSVEVASVTPFSARALDRGFAGALVGLARHAEPKLEPPQGVERIADVRAALERKLLDVFLERVREQPIADEAEREERLRSVQNRVVDLLDSWQKIFADYHAAGVAVQYQRYELKQPRPLLREMLDKNFESENHRKFRANRSLRDVEPEVNLFLKDLNGQPVEDHP